MILFTLIACIISCIHSFAVPCNAFWGLQSILEACMADMEAAKERDPACDKYTQCILYFKGFQAIQCQRIAHWLWNKDRKVGAASVAPVAPV